MLDDAYGVAVSAQESIDALPARAIHKATMYQYYVGHKKLPPRQWRRLNDV